MLQSCNKKWLLFTIIEYLYFCFCVFHHRINLDDRPYIFFRPLLYSASPTTSSILCGILKTQKQNIRAIRGKSVKVYYGQYEYVNIFICKVYKSIYTLVYIHYYMVFMNMVKIECIFNCFDTIVRDCVLVVRTFLIQSYNLSMTLRF